MLRTLRIIGDIAIHYIGVEPQKVINIYNKNLIMNETCIKSEIYRYICQPGQALCYKLGDNVIRHIVDKIPIENHDKFYSDFITGGMLPLDLLCQKYNINPVDIFWFNKI